MGTSKSLLQTCKDKIIQVITERSFEAVYNNTFELIEANTGELKGRAYRLRHKVYCEEHGVECPEEEGSYTERDEFDDRAVNFLLKHNVSHECAGTLRVILPNDECPGDSFPMQKICDHPLLRFDSRALKLCEISRFCMAPRFRKRENDGKFLSAYSDQDIRKVHDNGKVKFIRRSIPYAQAALLRGAFETAMQAQILDCIWMVEPAHLDSLQKIGFPYRILGPQLDIHGGMQPVIFNIKHVLDTMHREAPHCWAVVSDGGRLQDMADEVSRTNWQDDLMDDACKDMLYGQLLD